jgi:hypothetical protein
VGHHRGRQARGEFTASFLPRNRPLASGGDVLLHIAPGKGGGGALDCAGGPSTGVGGRVLGLQSAAMARRMLSRAARRAGAIAASTPATAAAMM